MNRPDTEGALGCTPDPSAARTAGLRLTRVLEAVGIRPGSVEALALLPPLEIRVRQSVADADTLATWIEEHTGQDPTAPAEAGGYPDPAYAAAMRLMVACHFAGVDVSAKATLDDALEPVLVVLATADAIEKLAALVEEHA